jgi:hypothetical protein
MYSQAQEELFICFGRTGLFFRRKGAIFCHFTWHRRTSLLRTPLGLTNAALNWEVSCLQRSYWTCWIEFAACIFGRQKSYIVRDLQIIRSKSEMKRNGFLFLPDFKASS